jgi:HSP20 family protein
MPQSIRYINQSAPFWDFIASMEQGEHPLFGEGQQGRRHHHHRGAWGHPSGPPPPFSHEDLPHRGPPPQTDGEETSPETLQHEEDIEMEKGENTDAPDPPEDTPNDGSGPSGDERRRRHGRAHGKHHRRGPRGGCERGERGERGEHSGSEHWGRRCGGGARGFGGPWGGRHHGHGHGHGWGHGPHRPRGFGFPWGQGGPDLSFLSGLFQPQQQQNERDNGDWSPDADVFDTPTSYVVHISLPGAKKEDIGVTWEPENSELIVAGVVHRPGDEEFLKTIAMDERKVGAFERKIRLGTRASPAHVDIDGIFAKHDNGILIIEVPKMIGDFVEVKKIDIE